ncbi:hypothetical protein [Nocardioides acrostichi]|uniref:Uncharacterized protein n=1 Tax=Nocardioides acrostichi TaxID=2784339 RepID=A0A930UVU6_9ACTN|nr:hypothetical protein [Nocardioides acrostichi]MBF4161096.1 hypothetical protein [Nocardioides acrostichi]
MSAPEPDPAAGSRPVHLPPGFAAELIAAAALDAVHVGRHTRGHDLLSDRRRLEVKSASVKPTGELEIRTGLSFPPSDTDIVLVTTSGAEETATARVAMHGTSISVHLQATLSRSEGAVGVYLWTADQAAAATPHRANHDREGRHVGNTWRIDPTTCQHVAL